MITSRASWPDWSNNWRFLVKIDDFDSILKIVKTSPWNICIKLAYLMLSKLLSSLTIRKIKTHDIFEQKLLSKIFFLISLGSRKTIECQQKQKTTLHRLMIQQIKGLNGAPRPFSSVSFSLLTSSRSRTSKYSSNPFFQKGSFLWFSLFRTTKSEPVAC